MDVNNSSNKIPQNENKAVEERMHRVMGIACATYREFEQLSLTKRVPSFS
jgi:hypothetical protein